MWLVWLGGVSARTYGDIGADAMTKKDLESSICDGSAVATEEVGLTQDAGRNAAKGRRARSIYGGKPAESDTRLTRVAPVRIGQDRGKQRRFMGVEVGGGLAECAARSGLDPELAIGTPFRDVEIDFEHAPFAEHAVEPQRQRKFQRLAKKAARRPQEQVLGGLLCDAGTAARLAQIFGLHNLNNALEIDPMMTAVARILRDEDRNHECRRDTVERDPNALDMLAFSPPPEHDGRYRRKHRVEEREDERQRQDQNEERHRGANDRPESGSFDRCHRADGSADETSASSAGASQTE